MINQIIVLIGIGKPHTLDVAIDQGSFFEIEPKTLFENHQNIFPKSTLYVSPPGHYK